jgi:hypothetical protein
MVKRREGDFARICRRKVDPSLHIRALRLVQCYTIS